MSASIIGERLLKMTLQDVYVNTLAQVIFQPVVYNTIQFAFITRLNKKTQF